MALRLVCRAKKLAKERKAALQKELEKKEEEEEVELADWMLEFDKNKNNLLEREELKELLHVLEPDVDGPSEDALDFLWRCHRDMVMEERSCASHSEALGSEEDHGEVYRPSELRHMLTKYREYVRRSTFLDEVFAKFDLDKSGKLEASASEIKALLEAVTSGKLSVQGDAVTERNARRVFKLRALRKAFENGTISQRTFNDKCDKAGGQPRTHSSYRNLADVKVTDGDVQFVLNQCDLNRDGAVGRDEVYACISVWVSLLADERRAERTTAFVDNLNKRHQDAHAETWTKHDEHKGTDDEHDEEKTDDTLHRRRESSDDRGKEPSPRSVASTPNSAACSIM